MADYPTSLPSFGADVVDSVDDVLAVHVNKLRAESLAIATELGTSPKTITDATAPAATPTSVAQYLDMVATALKTIHGGANWYNTAAAIMKSLVTTKGDLIVATASATPARLAVGTNGYLLIGDSAATEGVSWNGTLVIDKTNSRVGIGTASPTTGVEIYGTTVAQAQLKARAELTSASGGGGVTLHHNNASAALPSSGDRLGYVLFGSMDGATARNGGGIVGKATGAWSSTSLPTAFAFEVAPSGSTTRANIVYIASQGVIIGTTTTFPSGGGTPVLLLDQASGNPTGLPSNTAGVFAKDVAGTCEFFTIDEAGNVTQQTPHAADGPASLKWNKGLMPDIVISDENEFIGAKRWTNITLMAAALEWAMGQLAAMGRTVPAEFVTFMHEEKQEVKLDWDDQQAFLVAQRQAEIAKWEAAKAELEQQAAERDAEIAEWNALPEKEKVVPRPEPILIDLPQKPVMVTAKPKPAWMKAAEEKRQPKAKKTK